MNNITIEDTDPRLKELFSFREWRQRIHLFNELYTPGTRCEYEWEMCHLPENLNGTTFLDVGANDGMFSFLAEKKGAKRVKAVDLYVENETNSWNMTNGWPIGRITKIKELKGSGVEIGRCSVYDLSLLMEKFDTVYCGNVLAWLQNPYEALRQLSSVTGKRLLIREDVSKLSGTPVLEFVHLNMPNSCMFNGNGEYYTKALKDLGFKKVEIKPIDEYRIFERRATDFEKFRIPAGTGVFKNPFDQVESDQKLTSEKIVSASILVNNRFFFDQTGWVDKDAVKPVGASLIPKNPIKKMIFERKFRKEMLNNCLIIAER
jgi:tRNA (mo5U34)-methyltransferase